MFRSSLLAICAWALAACNQAGDRAPAHASQSPATASGETRQIDISNRDAVEANIRDLLGQVSAQFAPGGRAIPGFADVITPIQPGTDFQSAVELQAGAQYTFVGVCDADCTNVDLELLDGTTGEVVGSDLLDDDIPIVQHTPAANARFFVRLILRNCTQAPCYVGGRGLQAPG